MKKTLYLFFIILIVFSLVLTSCAKVIGTKVDTVDAIIVEIKVKHRPRPRHYSVLLKYQEILTRIDIPSREYHKYKKMVGTTIETNLVTHYYENGDTKQYLSLIR